MLKRLHIHNYAIIDEVTIDFTGNMSVITGETGAGKSILMGALSLILGDRADTSVLLNRNNKCVVEGSFITDGKQAVTEFLTAAELDSEHELLIRREIAVNGKSRAFINDTPVNLEQLRELSSLLVDLHRQFDTQDLGNMHFQLQVVDALAGSNALLSGYQEVFRQWQQIRRMLDTLLEEKNRLSKEYDYNQFLFDELEEAAFQPGELEALDQELKILSNSESIKSVLAKASFELAEGESPLVQQLKIIANRFQSVAAWHPALPALAERLLSAQIEISDIAAEIETLNDHIQYDERRIEQINERISTGYKLLKKHGVQTTGELLSIREQLAGKLQAVQDTGHAIETLSVQQEELLQQSSSLASSLSEKRKSVFPDLEKKVNRLLVQVGMPAARMKISSGLVTLNQFGIDVIEFLFDANKSDRFEPIRKVASGGELSRLMLCIKSLVAEKIDLPTLIFDEIDTGISGEAAKQVGLIMKELAEQRQVICITHQPQIAGKAAAHYFVYKDVRANQVKTGIRLLGREERISTIAQMLSGEKPTPAALENAREMVENY